MSAVVVDHLGIGSEVQLSALHAATVNARWEHNGTDLELHAVCDHPALHAAFTDLVHRADVVLKTAPAFDPAQELIGQLPDRANSDGLRPENQDGQAVFNTPLLRFRLSDDKVRELLMGRQLYGEPDLAIRELYQNALDACRYRDVRRRYLTRRECSIVDWSGRISFQQGTDPEGREFIECTDNGVGMSKDTMMSTFANAGERFVYRSGFRSEQMRWQELDPPLRLIPNSQFGVGVFSYFMIAEEIHITTRPVGEDDVVGPQAFNVRIASSGSLFQITHSSDMPAGGTRIRLYLTGEDSLSVLRTLRRLLWIAEYTVDVIEANGSRESWQPELLRFPRCRRGTAQARRGPLVGPGRRRLRRQRRPDERGTPRPHRRSARGWRGVDAAEHDQSGPPGVASTVRFPCSLRMCPKSSSVSAQWMSTCTALQWNLPA